MRPAHHRLQPGKVVGRAWNIWKFQKHAFFNRSPWKETCIDLMHGFLAKHGYVEGVSGIDVEAVSDDGVIEGIRVSGAPSFAVGVQWHAEWKPEEHALSGALYQAFGRAAAFRAAQRAGRRA